MTTRFSAREEQLLSDYLDDRLSERDGVALEKMLEKNQSLREALTDLRRLRIMLKRAPRYRTPRNFSLTPAMVEDGRRPDAGIWLPLMRFASAAAVFLLAAVFILEGLPGGIPAFRIQEAPAESAPAVMEFSAESAAIPDSPPIILWNSPADGRGGGMEGEPFMGLEPAPLESEALSKADSGNQALMAPAPTLAAPPLAENSAPGLMESAQEAPPQAAMLPTPQQPVPQSQPEEQAAASAKDVDTEPDILGIRPPEERAQISTPQAGEKAAPPVVSPLVADTHQKENPIWIWIKTALVLMALSTGMAAVLLQRKLKR
jgi:hypothetical protein